MNVYRTFGWLFCAVLLITALMAKAETAPLTTLRAFQSLTNAEASRGLPVSFTGSVTYYARGNVDLFVQDGANAVYVETTGNLVLSPGDRVLVTGVTRASFRPEVKANSVIVQSHGEPPASVQADFRQLIRAELDCRRATIRGFVRSANIINDVGNPTIYLRLQMNGGTVDAQIPERSEADLATLLDSEVEVTGAVAGRFDRKLQMTGIVIEVPSISDLKIIQKAVVDTKNLPVTPMDQILSGYEVHDYTRRIKVTGTITYFEPGSTLVLQSGDKSLLVTTIFEQPLQIGNVATVTGFPDVQNGSLILTSAAIEETTSRSPVQAIPSDPDVLARGDHAYDLVSIDGQLLSAVRAAAQDEYVFVSGSHLFKAILQHPQHLGTPLSAMPEIPAGSKVRIVGVCRVSKSEQSQEPTAFDVLLRSPADLKVIAGPPLLNVKNLTYLVGALLAGMVIIGIFAWHNERRGRSQTARLARTEQMRSRVLEHLNGSASLLDMVEEAAEIASFRLNGAACWCELASGEERGTRPKQLTGLRILEHRIMSRTGAELGIINAAFPEKTKPSRVEADILSMAAGIIALAFENRRLYSDLQHRSEFDLLTELHNRFSLEKCLAEMIERANADQTKFGLIYIDLDGFKAINDHYGHHIGDRYLQQATLRMKHQLRPNDLMARLGGDEFAVIVRSATTYEDVHAIVSRLENCFLDPFTIEGNQLRGAASFGIALYPVDANTQDGLLNSADAAMYVSKHERRERQRKNDNEDVGSMRVDYGPGEVRSL